MAPSTWWRHTRQAFELGSSLAVIAMAVLVFVGFFSKRPGTASASPSIAKQRVSIPQEPIQIVSGNAKGQDSASIVLVEFSDFECPYCRQFAQQTLPKIDASFISTGQVRMVFKHLPLPNHSQAVGAALAAECAGRQRAFWPMHDRLFADSNLSPIRFDEVARTLNLDLDSFTACRGESTTARMIENDGTLARQLNVASTPVFLIGVMRGQKIQVVESLSGARPFAEFEAAIGRVAASVESR